MKAKVDIKRVQARLLEMAITISKILEQNDIPYQIAFGTLLGAVRHGGLFHGMMILTFFSLMILMIEQ